MVPQLGPPLGQAHSPHGWPTPYIPQSGIIWGSLGPRGALLRGRTLEVSRLTVPTSTVMEDGVVALVADSSIHGFLTRSAFLGTGRALVSPGQAPNTPFFILDRLSFLCRIHGFKQWTCRKPPRRPSHSVLAYLPLIGVTVVAQRTSSETLFGVLVGRDPFRVRRKCLSAVAHMVVLCLHAVDAGPRRG